MGYNQRFKANVHLRQGFGGQAGKIRFCVVSIKFP
jgi:hypothetical protein